MATIHLVEGPVGSGKSTYSAQLSLQHSAPKLDLDEWMVTLFRPDRPSKDSMSDFMQWYSDRKDRCIEQIWKVACELIDTGTDVILELGLVQSDDRAFFYNRVDVAGYQLKVYVLDVPKEVRQQRVRNRNEQSDGTFKMEVTDEIFEIANAAWQAPGEVETREREIEVITVSG